MDWKSYRVFRWCLYPFPVLVLLFMSNFFEIHTGSIEWVEVNGPKSLRHNTIQ